MMILSYFVVLSVVVPIVQGLSAPKIQNEPIDGQDSIKIHESLKPITYHGVKNTDLAPESKLIAVYFDVDNISRFAPEIDSTSGKSSTKQSQNFEVGDDQTAPIVSTSSALIENVQQDSSITVGPSTQSPTSSPSTEQPSSLNPSTEEPKPENVTSEPAIDQEPNDSPVGSRTIRAGSAVQCGEANPNGKSNKRLILDRIIGGRKTEPGEFPFQVRLNIRSRRGSGICGGVILDDRHILTAAHCMTACVSQYLTTVTMENTSVHATIGDHSIRSNDGEVEIDVASITPHEKYDACNFYANDHDIAIIKTSTPIEYKFTSDGYGSINRPCMPSSSKMVYKDGEPVIVSGWGVTRDNSGSLSNILRYVQVPVVNVTRCQETYGTRVTNDHVCAGYQSGGKDSCQGDSGGPLVRVVDNRYELVGIVSFGYGCGQPGAPGVYTRVASYIDWIKANM